MQLCIIFYMKKFLITSILSYPLLFYLCDHFIVCFTVFVSLNQEESLKKVIKKDEDKKKIQ